MDPTENQKKLKQMTTFIIIAFIVLTILTLRGAVYMKEINDDNYISALAQGLTDITSGNFAIFPLNNLTLKYEFYTIFIIAVISGLWYGYYAFNKDMMRGKEFGSTDFNSDFNKYNKTYSDPKGSTSYNGDYNMILGENIRLNLDTRKTRRNNNVLCTGGSGTGKSRFLCGPNILQANTSYVITDPSGELLRDYGSFLEGQGYKIKVFNLVDMVHSNCYNPFHYIRDDLGVMIMINCLIRNTDNGGKGGDPFWEKSETALLQALIFYLIKYRPKEEQNFNSVLSLIELAHIDENNPNAKSQLDKIFESVEKEDPHGIAIKQYKIFKQGAGKTLKSILISAAVRLSVFNIKEISKLTKVDNLDLGKVGDEKTALFVIIPSADSTYNFMVSMMYSQLFETLYYHAENECGFSKRLPYHVRFLLDEFANIGQIPEFEKKLATMRKYEISCTIILQSLSQLKTLYKDSWNGIIGNCDTYLHLGSQEEETNKYVSDLLGTKTIRSENISRTNRSGKKGSTSNGRQARKLMMPEEIAQMDNLQCLILIRGLRPFKVNKYPLEKHPNYKFTGGANKNNNFEIKKHPELLIKDNVTLQDIKREIKKSQINRIIGKPQNAVTGILEAFNTTLDTKANDYLKSQIPPVPISTSIEQQIVTENKKEEQIYQNSHNHEFDNVPVHTITEKNIKNSEIEIRNKKNSNNNNNNDNHNNNNHYNNKNNYNKNHHHNKNNYHNNKKNNHYNNRNNHNNKNNQQNNSNDDIEDTIEYQMDFNINSMLDDVMDDDFN